MEKNLAATAARRLWTTVFTTALAVGFASGFAVLGASAEPSHDGAQTDEPAHTCPHAKAAAAEGAAAAPCDHAADGSCASCSAAKDCPHSKDGSCSDCSGEKAAPETH